MSEGAKWYVIHTYSGYEKKVADTIKKTVENRGLQEMIFDICLPMETTTEKTKDGKTEVRSAIVLESVMNPSEKPEKKSEKKPARKAEAEGHEDTEVKPDGEVTKQKLAFPGYVLVKMYMNDESWYVIRNTRGVTSFVGPGSKPVPLSEEEIAALGGESIKVELSYGVGDSVKVIDGPMDGHIGTVTAISMAESKVYINVSMFGRETPIELDFNQVAALKK